MILLIIYVKIFKTGIIVFISDVKICLSSHLPIIFKISQFLRMRVTNRAIFFFVDQGQLSDPDFISCTHQKENVQFAKNYCYHYTCTCRGEEGSISSPTLSHFSASEVGANKLSCLTTSFNSMVIEDRVQ
jgi:hypothetical protein